MENDLIHYTSGEGISTAFIKGASTRTVLGRSLDPLDDDQATKTFTHGRG